MKIRKSFNYLKKAFYQLKNAHFQEEILFLSD